MYAFGYVDSKFDAIIAECSGRLCAIDRGAAVATEDSRRDVSGGSLQRYDEIPTNVAAVTGRWGSASGTVESRSMDMIVDQRARSKSSVVEIWITENYCSTCARK